MDKSNLRKIIIYKIPTLKSGSSRPRDPIGSKASTASTKPNFRKGTEGWSDAFTRMVGLEAKA